MPNNLSLSQAFKTLASNIELAPSSAQLISDRYNAISSQLRAELQGTAVQQIGSFQRKTKINPAEPEPFLDLDVALVFGVAEEWQLRQYSPGNLMSQVLRVLIKNKTYKSMRPRKDAPTITVEYADQTAVEIVPCIKAMATTAGRSPYYYVPETTTTWKRADYDYDYETITRLNQSPECKGRLVPSIKIIKSFLRRKKRFGLSAWNVEVLCAQTIPGILVEMDMRGYGWGYHDVLVEFLCRVPRYMSLPAVLYGSHSTPANSQLSSSQLANASNQYMAMGTHFRNINGKPVQEALKAWKQWFGSVFPTI